MKVTILNNELILSDKFPSSTGTKLRIAKKSRACIGCYFFSFNYSEVSCGDLPFSALNMCQNNSIWRLR